MSGRASELQVAMRNQPAALTAYEAYGLLTQVTDAYSNVTSSIGYNVSGMKTSSTDMDLGSWTYLPNALGEIEKVRDAKTSYPNWTTELAFDALGRVTQTDDQHWISLGADWYRSQGGA